MIIYKELEKSGDKRGFILPARASSPIGKASMSSCTEVYLGAVLNHTPGTLPLPVAASSSHVHFLLPNQALAWPCPGLGSNHCAQIHTAIRPVFLLLVPICQ